MLSANYQKLQQQIHDACLRAGRDSREVKLVAVTKRVPLEKIKEAVSLGIKDLGENRLQEALAKLDQFQEKVDWHFVGHLQTNKVGDALQRFSLIHSLDRMKLAGKLENWAKERGKVVSALVQVNVSGETSKFGVDPAEVKDFLVELRSLQGLRVSGLMAMAPLVDDPEEARPYFRRLRELRQEANCLEGISLEHLSMGMTNDFTVAIEEGATLVRLGTALFGPRPIN